MKNSNRIQDKKGFTLLEILVATALLGVAITVVLQLFSSNIRAISDSSDYVKAATWTEIKMRELLDSGFLEEKSYRETTNDGYTIDVSITETLKERTENLNVRLFEIVLTTHWLKGIKEKSFTLRTLKTVRRE